MQLCVRAHLVNDWRNRGERLERVGRDLGRAFDQRMTEPQQRLGQFTKLLESLSYKGVLQRGYAVVRGGDGAPLSRAADVTHGATLAIEFADGAVAATAGEGALPPAPAKAAKPAPKPKAPRPAPIKQGDLF